MKAHTRINMQAVAFLSFAFLYVNMEGTGEYSSAVPICFSGCPIDLLELLLSFIVHNLATQHAPHPTGQQNSLVPFTAGTIMCYRTVERREDEWDRGLEQSIGLCLQETVGSWVQCKYFPVSQHLK